MIFRRTGDASLSSRYHYILHYCSELRLDTGITFTFAGFLLFSVMPRVIVAEIESAAPLDTPNVLKMCIAPPIQRERKFAGTTTILYFRDGNENARWFIFLEHDANLAYIQFNIQYPTRYVMRGTSFILQYCYLDLRRHCWCKSVNRNVKHSARPVPQCTENGCELNTFSDISLMYVI